MERLRGSLESMRSGKPFTPADNEALNATTSYIDSYFRGLQSGAQLMEAAKVVAAIGVEPRRSLTGRGQEFLARFGIAC